MCACACVRVCEGGGWSTKERAMRQCQRTFPGRSKTHLGGEEDGLRCLDVNRSGLPGGPKTHLAARPKKRHLLDRIGIAMASVLPHVAGAWAWASRTIVVVMGLRRVCAAAVADAVIV